MKNQYLKKIILKFLLINNLNLKKKEICEIFYNTVIKWFLRDVLDLTKRFINKSILKFESNIPYQ